MLVQVGGPDAYTGEVHCTYCMLGHFFIIKSSCTLPEINILTVNNCGTRLLYRPDSMN